VTPVHEPSQNYFAILLENWSEGNLRELSKTGYWSAEASAWKRSV